MADNPSPTPASAQKTAKPPANAFEIIIGFGSWGGGILMQNLVVTAICIILIGIGYAGWMRYHKKNEYDVIMYGKR